MMIKWMLTLAQNLDIGCILRAFSPFNNYNTTILSAIYSQLHIFLFRLVMQMQSNSPSWKKFVNYTFKSGFGRNDLWDILHTKTI